MILRKFSVSILIFILIIIINLTKAIKSSPNIVLIVADDMGFDDVSFRGSNEFLTPNIDALAYNGMILNNYYVPPMCTPSRAALMTGKYPINIGMQHYVIANYEPWGLPLNEKTMGEIFRDAGYSTNLIGKWHLGYFNKSFTPLYRGFDHHYGYYGGYIDYYNKILIPMNTNLSQGYDFRRDLAVECSKNDTYVTDLLTNEATQVIDNHNENKPLLMILNHMAPHTGNSNNPLQAPEEEMKKFPYIDDPKRQAYAAMVSKLDESVGKIIEALDKKQLLNNTIIVFYSDNGAPTKGLHANSGSNYPLKGQKDSPWEGGIRSSGIIWSPFLQKPHTVWNQTIYVADWLPTLTAAAGITLNDQIKFDGLNLWQEIITGAKAETRKIVHNIDGIANYISYLDWPFKYINGTTSNGIYDNWLGKRNVVSIDPRSKKYSTTIRKSMASKYLKKFAITRLSNRKIHKIRSKAQVKCNTNMITCDPLLSECLFNIKDDPCEQENLANLTDYKDILIMLKTDIELFRKNAHIPENKPIDYNSDPRKNNCLWTWWKNSVASDSNACQCQ